MFFVMRTPDFLSTGAYWVGPGVKMAGGENGRVTSCEGGHRISQFRDLQWEVSSSTGSSSSSLFSPIKLQGPSLSVLPWILLAPSWIFTAHILLRNTRLTPLRWLYTSFIVVHRCPRRCVNTDCVWVCVCLWGVCFWGEFYQQWGFIWESEPIREGNPSGHRRTL